MPTTRRRGIRNDIGGDSLTEGATGGDGYVHIESIMASEPQSQDNHLDSARTGQLCQRTMRGSIVAVQRVSRRQGICWSHWRDATSATNHSVIHQ